MLCTKVYELGAQNKISSPTTVSPTHSASVVGEFRGLWAREMAQQLRVLTQRIRVQIPGPILGSSQLPLTLASGYLKPSSGLESDSENGLNYHVLDTGSTEPMASPGAKQW